MNMNDILTRLANGVRDMEEDKVAEAAYTALEMNIEPLTAINEGLVVGMNEAGRLYEEEQYFVPELLLCSDAMYIGLNILSPHIKKEDQGNKVKVVIGVVEGDTHDIGKNLVKMMMEAGGFEMYDLGRDVPLSEFVSQVKNTGAQVLCMSTLMSTTMDGMGKVIKMLETEGIRDQVIVMVGGGPVSKAFADKIGADAYTSNANAAVRKLKEILANRETGCSEAVACGCCR